jgi:hypothetical protein
MQERRMKRRWREMGGRYGGSDDGSSEYQDRRPDADDRQAEQQTIAEAVQAISDRHQQQTDQSESGGGDRSDSGNQHPFTSVGSGNNATSGRTTVQNSDSVLGEYFADKLTDSVQEGVEDVDPDSDSAE